MRERIAFHAKLDALQRADAHERGDKHKIDVVSLELKAGLELELARSDHLAPVRDAWTVGIDEILTLILRGDWPRAEPQR
jgi:hypothetical protein